MAQLTHSHCERWSSSSKATMVSTYMNEGRDNHLHSPVDDLEAVGVIKSHNVGPHKREDWHDIVQNFFLNRREQKESLIVFVKKYF